MSSYRSANFIRVQPYKKFSVAAKGRAHKLDLLQKRRDSDAKCRANLSFSFEQLKKQVLDDTTINTRVSREMVLQETLWKIQYLEGILVLLEQTKDKQQGKSSVKSSVARLDAIHKEFTKLYSSSISHGNRKPKERFLSEALCAYENKKLKLIRKQSSQVKILPKLTTSTGNGSKTVDTADQVVPKPSSQVPKQTRMVKESPPHTIIVPYIGHQNGEYGSQEVPVGAEVRGSTSSQELSTPPGYHTTNRETFIQGTSDSPNGTPSSRYKIKGSSIKCVPADNKSWDMIDLETSDDDSVDADSTVEPDLTCKEVFPHWLNEEDRNGRQVRKTSTVTPLKPPNTSQMTYPYPMAPRKNKNTNWSAKYMEHVYENTINEEHSGFQRQQQRPAGKRLFAETSVDVTHDIDYTWSSPYIQSGNYDVKPKRHYRKLCTAARVRPYNAVTGKVESPCKRYCRTTKRKANRSSTDPEFCVNSYYKRKMRKDDKGYNSVVPSRRQTKESMSPQVVYPGVDVMENWIMRQEERQKKSSIDYPAIPDNDEENSSQSSLVLTDVPHLPEDIISPLDIDDTGIVDTILDLEESSIPSIDTPTECGSAYALAQLTKPAASKRGDDALQGGLSMKQEHGIWNAPRQNDVDFHIITNDGSNESDAISPALAAYASLALSNTALGTSCINTTSPSKQDPRKTRLMSPSVVYFSPVKQNPLIGSNPSWCSTLLMNQTDDDDQLLDTTKESYSDLSFVSPLSTSGLIGTLGSPLVIDVNHIKDVKEVQFTSGELALEQLDKDADFWDIDKMMEINSSLDELIDREVFLCSPKMVPRNFIGCSQDVEVPCGVSSKLCTSDNMDQLLPSSWKLKDAGNHMSSQDSILEYQVVPNFLPGSEGDDEILNLSLKSDDLN